MGSITLVVIYLSFINTQKLANLLHLPPVPTAFLVEIAFTTLLVIRSRQRTQQLNVPLFLDTIYFAFLIFVTGVNVWGLAQINGVIGTIVGFAISGAMWSMETTFVWLVTESDQPYQPTIKDELKEAKKKIKEEQIKREIEWMWYEAKKPDLKLIQKARKADEKRKQVLEDGLPEFFQHQINTVPPVQVGEGKTPKDKVVKMNPIGFHVNLETSKSQGVLQSEEDFHQHISNLSPTDNPPATNSSPAMHQSLANSSPSSDTDGYLQIQHAVETAEGMLSNGWRLNNETHLEGKKLGRGTLAKAAGVTVHYARIAIDRVKQKRQAN